MKEISEFEVTDHFYLKERGGFVIGNIKSGLFKMGMVVSCSEEGQSLTISGIEYLDNLKEKNFKNALVFKEKPSVEFVKSFFPVGCILKSIEKL